MVLGLDMMRRYKCFIDYEKNMINFDNDLKIHFYSDS
jgi:hypothetical protein